METGKTARYFKYAIGEIFLVVIGILIALQINNWNEDYKRNELRLEILQNLKFDLEQDLSRLSVIDRFLEDRKNYSKLILNYLRNPPKKIDSIKTFLALERSGYMHTFNPPMPTYSEIQSSGNLSLIKATDIKKSLAYYKTFILTNSKIEMANSKVFQTYSNSVLAYMDEDFGYLSISDTVADSYKGLKFNLEKMAKDANLRLLLKNVYNKSIVEQRYKRDLVKPRVEKLIDLIDKEIKLYHFD